MDATSCWTQVGVRDRPASRAFGRDAAAIRIVKDRQPTYFEGDSRSCSLSRRSPGLTSGHKEQCGVIQFACGFSASLIVWYDQTP